MLLGALAVAVSLVAAATSVGSGPARAAGRAGTASSPHVVIVGLYAVCGVIAIVPCFLLLLMAMAGIRITIRRVAVVLGSGVAVFAVFALINYRIPATGPSDVGAFPGNLFHGHAGALLARKWTSMIGSLTVSTYSPLVPLVVVIVGLIRLKPSWFRVRAIPRGYSAEPLLAMTLAMVWLVGVLAGVPLTGDQAADHGLPVTGPSITGRIRSPARSGA
jgi:hypothetical protein